MPTGEGLGEALDRAYRRRNVTQDEAARECGTSQATFSKWLDGARPREERWPQIAAFLGLPVERVAEMVPPATGGPRARSRDQDRLRLRALEEQFHKERLRREALAEEIERFRADVLEALAEMRTELLESRTPSP